MSTAIRDLAASSLSSGPRLKGPSGEADTTNVETELFHLVLVDLPPEVSGPHLGVARPLGERAAVTARLVDLLPGTTFNAEGQGSFKRANYQISFTVEEHAPHSIAVEVDHREGFAPLKRIVAKTGWRIIDPAGPSFVDLDRTAATGVLVPLILQPSDTAGSTTGERSGSHRWLGVAAGVGLVGLIWVGWQRNHPAPTSTSRSVSTPVAASGSGEDFMRLADDAKAKAARMKLIAPDFRTDPIVNQLYDYRQAAAVFPSSVGGGGFMSPERLSDAAFFEAIHTRPYLPPTFAQSERDGYRFDFVGANCTGTNPYLAFLGNLCKSFAYVARPLRGTRSKRSYALLSSDFRVHYRHDGAMPTPQDLTVDNPGPTTVEVAKAEAQPKPEEPTGLLVSVRRAATGVIDQALGRRQVEIQLHESSAIEDLRVLSAAENAFNSSIGEGRYAAPEQLADEETFASLSIQPYLPATFVQPRRQGYQFEFVGQNGMTPVGPLASLGLLYDSFVYVARPIEPGPSGQRTFAVYPNGRVFVTRERRVPTSSDEQVGTR